MPSGALRARPRSRALLIALCRLAAGVPLEAQEDQQRALVEQRLASRQLLPTSDVGASARLGNTLDAWYFEQLMPGRDVPPDLVEAQCPRSGRCFGRHLIGPPPRPPWPQNHEQRHVEAARRVNSLLRSPQRLAAFREGVLPWAGSGWLLYNTTAVAMSMPELADDVRAQVEATHQGRTPRPFPG